MSETETVAAESYLGDDGALQDGWMGNLPDGTFEKDDTGKNKVGDLADHKDVAGIVKSYMNGQKLLGTAIQPLADDASDEDKRAYHTKQGCPEKADGYEVKIPDMPDGMGFDEDLMTAMKQYAFDTGMPKTRFEGLAMKLLEGQIAAHTKRVEAAKIEQDKVDEEAKVAQDKVAEEADNKLKGKWGADHDKFVEMARRAYDIHGGKEFVDLMESSGLKDNAIVVETFLNIFKQTNPKEFVDGSTPGGKATVQGQLSYPKSDM